MRTTVTLTVTVPEDVAELAAKLSRDELARAIERGVIYAASAKHLFEKRMAAEAV